MDSTPASWTDVLFLVPASFFVVRFVRALPWPAAWRAKKPLSCDACMTGWTLIGFALANYLTHLNWDIVGWFAVGGVVLLLLDISGRLGSAGWPTPPEA